MAAEFRTFWGALLSVLLKCMAALGIAAPARIANRTPQATAPVAGRTPAPVGADRKDPVGVEATVCHGELPRWDTPPTRPATRRADVRIPAPRACRASALPLPARRERGLTLPPTMKQRISAEAHGSSPSARSLRAGSADPTADEITPCL